MGRHTGSCLCGAIRYVADADLEGVSICHCIMCRRATMLAGAHAPCPREALTISGRGLKWFRSTPRARRGFCGRCGSQLFWQGDDEPVTYISAGSLDSTDGLHVMREVFKDQRPGFVCEWLAEEARKIP